MVQLLGTAIAPFLLCLSPSLLSPLRLCRKVVSAWYVEVYVVLSVPVGSGECHGVPGVCVGRAGRLEQSE